MQQWSHFTRHFIIIFHIAPTIIERLLLIIFDISPSYSSTSLVVSLLQPLITDSALFTMYCGCDVRRSIERERMKESERGNKKWWKRYSPNSNEVTNCWPVNASNMRKMCMLWLHDLLDDILLDAIFFIRLCSKKRFKLQNKIFDMFPLQKMMTL